MRKFHNKSNNSNTLAKFLYIISLCVLSFGYGYLAFTHELFPHSIIRDAKLFIDKKIKEPELPYYYVKTDYTTKIPVYDEHSTSNGLSLVTSVIEDKKLSARVIDLDGELIHEWDIDWFELWSDVTHIPKSAPDYPRSHPGTHIHGALLLKNGDLIFNFTN